MSDVDNCARWLEVYAEVGAILASSKDFYPNELRIGWRFIPQAAAYMRGAIGDAANVVAHDYEVTVRGFVNAVFKHESDPALDVAADLLLRFHSNHVEPHNLQELVSKMLRGRAVFDEPTPGWFWNVALFTLDAGDLLKYVTYVPSSHFQELTQAFTTWFEPGPAVATTSARKEWFDIKRLERDDEWASYSSGQFWALFNV
jgi:hypothetical protein